MIRQIERVRKMHRRAVEVLYEDTCNIYVRKSEKDEKTKITAKKEVLMAENQPCRLSYETVSTTKDNQGAAEKEMAVKLFLPPEPEIPEGSRIDVIHQGLTISYSNSGSAARALAMPILCLCPPLNSCGYRLAWSAFIPTASSSWRILLSLSLPLSLPCMSRGSPTISRTVILPLSEA